MQILSAYFVVLPLRDEGAISLGLGSLPGLFAGSLLLTVLAAPVASLAFSLPSIPKPRVRATPLPELRLVWGALNSLWLGYCLGLVYTSSHRNLDAELWNVLRNLVLHVARFALVLVQCRKTTLGSHKYETQFGPKFN